ADGIGLGAFADGGRVGLPVGGRTCLRIGADRGCTGIEMGLAGPQAAGHGGIANRGIGFSRGKAPDAVRGAIIGDDVAILAGGSAVGACDRGALADRCAVIAVDDSELPDRGAVLGVGTAVLTDRRAL